MDSVEWKRIKAEYLAGGTSYRKLAKKYEVKLSALRSVAEREHWVELKTQTQHKTNTKLTEVVSDKETKKAVDLFDIADVLAEKVREIAKTVSDPDSIKKLTSAIKDLRDIKGIKSEADMREQEARINKLRKEAEDDTPEDREVNVTFIGDIEQYSK